MANYDKAIKRLQSLLTEQDLQNIPHQVDDKIIIGPIVVKPTKSGSYIVIDRSKDTRQFFDTKLCAVAYAKNIKTPSITQNIIHIDKIMSKHNNDCIFYKHTMKKTKSIDKKIVAEDRYYISKYYVSDCKEKIYKMIFN